MLVSVIIPHYKRPNLTLQAIKSVLRQKKISPNQIEIIILDDDRPPSLKTRTKLKKLLPSIIYATNQHQEGPGGNRQTGLNLARGKYIVFLDSDDRLKPDFLSWMIIDLQKHRLASAAVCLSSLVFDQGFPYKLRLKIALITFLRNLGLLLGYFFNNGRLFPSSFYFCQLSHMIFRASVAKKLNFNYDYRHGGEDWDFSLQAFKHGPIRVLPLPLLWFRYAPSSSTFVPKNLERKWQSYSLLISRLNPRFRRGIFYQMFRLYIKVFWK